jgi:DNA polymerase III subunit chi
MGEVLFYHLTQTPLEQTLPDLLGRALERGWRCVVQAGTSAAVDRLDALLWTFSDEAFLPHGTRASAHPDAQPVYLTDTDENPAGATVAMLVEGARLSVPAAQGLTRTCLLFNGHDPEALQTARADWVAARDGGLTGTYWAQEDGRWVKKATTGDGG